MYKDYVGKAASEIEQATQLVEVARIRAYLFFVFPYKPLGLDDNYYFE